MVRDTLVRGMSRKRRDDLGPGKGERPLDHDAPTAAPRPDAAERRLRADAAADDWVGGRIGRYRIERLIAEGGMGRVYQATHELTGQVVALKTMRPGFEMERFVAEMRTLGALQHPG